MTLSRSPAHYRERSWHLLTRVDAELAMGEPELACEALWGAAAYAVKAAAEQRGWVHNQHRLLRVAVTRLVAEGAPPYLLGQYLLASDFHQGFYGDRIFTATHIAAVKAPIADFIRTLEGLA